MVKFEFVLDDVDAENLLACIREQQIKSLEAAQVATATDQPDDGKWLASWHKKRAAYLSDLAEKVAKGSSRP
jgi:hypothetical protein